MAPPTSVTNQTNGLAAVGYAREPDREMERISPREELPAGKRPAASGREKLQQLTAAVDEMNRRAQTQQRSVRFSIERELNLAVVKVINPDTDEVIRQIPSEEFIDRAKATQQSRISLFEAEV